MKVIAYKNHARWVAECPVCGGAEIVAPGEPFVCAVCNPGIRANRFRPFGNPVRFAKEPDHEVREQAYKVADKYEVEFPKDKQRIDELLSKRPTKNANWIPTETVKDLEAENMAHGVK